MTATYASFRELKGIGPAAEAQLHEAGIHTWAALAETLDAVARVRGVDAPLLRSLRDAARDRTNDADRAVAADGERTSRFVVSVVTRPDGVIARTSVTDVRSELTRPFTGISGKDIVGFIEQRLGDRPSVPDEPKAPEKPELMESADSDPGVPISFAASSIDGDIVVIDAGKALAGAESDIVLRWDTSGIEPGEGGTFRYRASLAGRPYGGSEIRWRPLGLQAGIASGGDIVELSFETAGLSPGINRLELTIEVESQQQEATTAQRRIMVG